MSDLMKEIKETIDIINSYSDNFNSFDYSDNDQLNTLFLMLETTKKLITNMKNKIEDEIKYIDEKYKKT